MKPAIRLLLVLLGWTALGGTAARGQNVCASPGKDGSTFSADPNTYYPGVGTAAKGATSISVGTLRAGGSTTAIAANDLLLVIQMQGADINNSDTDSYGDGVSGGAASGYLTTNLTAGQYEYVVAAGAVSGGTVPLTSGLLNTYVTSAVSTTATLRTFQVVRVPQYTSLTLTANIVPPGWNGSTGGIVALDVRNNLNFGTYTIDASALGFRGGAGIKQAYTATNSRVDYLTTASTNAATTTTANPSTQANGLNAQKGEGIAGSPRYVNIKGATALFDTGTDNYPGGSSGRGAPGNAGGGGNDNGNNSGGGGGANGGTGGHGGYSSITGTPSSLTANNTTTSYIGGEPGALFTASSSILVMGGGGGAGTTNDGTGNTALNGFASSGAPGGGIVLVRTGTVSGTGGISANGGNSPTGVQNDGAGGAGAGGSILLTASTSQTNMANLTMSAIGGTGGSTNPSASAGANAHGPGGGGGGGVIFTTAATKTTLATSTAGGTNGTSTPGGNVGTAAGPFGATAGTSGASGSSTSSSNSIANSASGAVCSTISGTIFDDSNYGGGAGRSYSTANTSAKASGLAEAAIGSVGTTVELYSSTGALVATTTSTTGGAYSFTDIAYGTYTVRVVNSTVKSGRTAGATGVVPVQTFSTTASGSAGIASATANPNRVGGEAPEKQDAAANSGSQTLAALSAGTLTPQSIASVTAGTTGVDFGFNFDVVSNSNNTGQGSLAQFITNANAIGNEAVLAQAGSRSDINGATLALAAGTESSIFMIPNGATSAPPAGLRTGLVSGLDANGVATITVATALPTITGATTSVDGSTQTYNIGNTNNVTLGTGGTVGTASTALNQSNGPEVQLVGPRGNFDGLTVSANNVTVRALGAYGFVNDITVTNDVTNVLITRNVLGTSATSFTDPGATKRSTGQGVFLNNSDSGNVRNNLIAYNGGMGVWVLGDGNGANSNTISNNEIRGNGQEVNVGNGERLVFDGLELQGASTGNTVSGNLITANLGHGIDNYNNTVGGNTITGNTISNNGVGVVNNTGEEGSGLRIYASTNTTTISTNILSGNNGSGVLVEATANNVTISQNSTFGNTRLGIDLLSTADGNTTATTYNGATGTASNVSLNDTNDSDTGGNGVLNFPVLTSATIVGNNLVLRGYARPGSAIELFAASATANSVAANVGFGQGQTYLGTFTEGSAADGNSGTGTYSGTINGLSQGTDATNLFSFTIPLTGNFANLATGTVLTSTATLSNSTSEFSGNVTVRPTASNDFATTTVGTAVTFAVTTNDTAGNAASTIIDLDPSTSGTQTSYTVAGQGTFTTVDVVAGQVKFTPADNLFTGTVTIPYVVSNSANPSALSNQASLSVYVTPGLDLSTTVTASSATNSVTSNSAVTYTVTDMNNSTFTASNVVGTLQLPAGLTNNGGTVTISGAGSGSSYNNTTGVVTFATTSLGANTTNTYTVAVSNVPTSGIITATSTITSTGNGQESNTTNNVATASLSIIPSYDVATALTGPVDANGNAVTVVTGDLVTYAVRTSNAATATSAAPAVVQTVSFDGDLTANGLFISNGGTAAYDATAKKTIVTFPALPTLAAGQSVLNTISFVVPGSSYTTTATVMANDNNVGDTGTANNTTSALNTTVKAATGSSVNVTTSISTGSTQAIPGEAVTLTVVTANAGPSTANNVVQQVQLPAGLSGVTFPNSNGSYSATTGLVTFTTLTTLPSGSSNGANVTTGGTTTANPNAFKVQFNAPATGVVLATAFVSEDNADVIPADNVAEVKVNVNSLTDLTTEIEGPATATVGQAVTYSVVTSNLSSTAASSVVERVQLPPNLGAGSITFSGPATGRYDNATGVVTLTFSDGVPANIRLTNTVAFTMPASTITDPSGTVTGGNILAVAADVRTATPESNATNNTALVATSIVPTADVRVSLSGPSTLLVGSPATYVVTTSNDGAATAASVSPTLQLPAGLTNNSGVVTITGNGGGTYNNTTGLVTFPTLVNLPNGGSSSSTVTVTMPDVAEFTPVAQVQVSAATIDRDLSNNRAQLMAYPAMGTSPTADLSASLTITTGSASPVPNAPITLTATFANATGGGSASQVVPRLTLAAGLLANGANAVTVGNGGTYDNTTGLVTWPTVNALAAGSSLPGSYTISFITPSSGPVTATAYVASSTSDTAPANNVQAVTLNVDQSTDITTNISGPDSNVPVLPGSRVTYTVVTTNAGPAPATNDVTQTVRVPSGIDLTTVSYPAGSTFNTSTRTITFPVVKGLSVGSVVNYVSFNAPTANYSVTGMVSMPNELGAYTDNNIALANTVVNRAPVAYNAVNMLQSPQGSSAAALLLSPLVATDADASSTLTYRITTLPSAATGVLTLNSTPITTSSVLSSDDIKSLYFNPVGTISSPTAYIGNTFFSYVAIDNQGATSAPALYTIAIGKDNASQYTQVGTGKVYQNADVVANVIDANAARYDGNGQIYNATTGTLVATDGSVSNGLSNAVATATADANILASNGLTLNAATGQITVGDRSKLPTSSITFNITTTDANGGTNTTPVTLAFSAPLPVTLLSFTAQATRLDAILQWQTASEQHNDHFEVERSFDGVSFGKLAQVAGHGTTSTSSAYSFTDMGVAAKANGPVYYRLRQVDTDGTATYSPLRTVSFTNIVLAKLTLFPNPVATRTTLDLSSLPATASYQAQVLDATGRQVRTWNLAGGVAQLLDLSELASGSYLLVVTGQQPDGSLLKQTLRLTKE